MITGAQHAANVDGDPELEGLVRVRVRVGVGVRVRVRVRVSVRQRVKVRVRTFCPGTTSPSLELDGSIHSASQ